MKRYKRYIVVPYRGAPIAFRFRWPARLFAWVNGYELIDTHEQVTL